MNQQQPFSPPPTLQLTVAPETSPSGLLGAANEFMRITRLTERRGDIHCSDAEYHAAAHLLHVSEMKVAQGPSCKWRRDEKTPSVRPFIIHQLRAL